MSFKYINPGYVELLNKVSGYIIGYYDEVYNPVNGVSFSSIYDSTLLDLKKPINDLYM